MIYYASGDEIRAGDQLGPGMQWSGQVSRVVVVIPTAEAAEGYVGSDWTYLETGVMVEHINASGAHLVHYPAIDEDFELLCRASDM